MNIAVLQIYDDNIKSYAEYSRLFNAIYSYKHKYTYICFEYDLAPAFMSVYYNKLLATLAVFNDTRNFDWVLYLDSDAAITNFDYTIEEIIDRHAGKEIIMGSDENGSNNGVYLIKNTQNMKEFIAKAIQDKTCFHTKTPEQTAMFQLLKETYAEHLGIEPAHFFNAYLEGYENHTAQKENINFWDKDSFILHLMMLSSEDRSTIFRQTLIQENIICIPKPKELSHITRQNQI